MIDQPSSKPSPVQRAQEKPDEGRPPTREPQKLEGAAKDVTPSSAASGANAKLASAEIKTEGAPVESRILAQTALNQLARQIADKIAEKVPPPANVWIHNDEDMFALMELRAFLVQVQVMNDDLKAEALYASSLLAQKHKGSEISLPAVFFRTLSPA